MPYVKPNNSFRDSHDHGRAHTAFPGSNDSPSTLFFTTLATKPADWSGSGASST
jgi:hypothetical protein